MSLRTREAIYDEVLGLYLRGYQAAALLIGVYYLALIPIHFTAQAPGVGLRMILPNLLTSAVFLVSNWGIRKGWILPRQWPLVAVTCLLVPTGNHLMLVGFTGRLELTSDLMLILVAASVVSPQVKWHLAILAACLASWTSGVVFLQPSGDFKHWGTGLLSACLVSLALHGIVSRLSWMQARLRVKDAHRAEQQRRITERLQEALDRVQTLQGLIPMCGHCKKIREDGGYWTQVEQYVEERSRAEFTHGICPECESQLKGEFEALLPEGGA